MRSPNRRRPQIRAQADATGKDLAAIAARVSYVGSAEHKRYPSAAGPPALRSDATPCPPNLAPQNELTNWLRRAVSKGAIGEPWEHDFPRYAWVTNENGIFEARLINREQGTYKGYPLQKSERPSWL